MGILRAGTPTLFHSISLYHIFFVKIMLFLKPMSLGTV